MSIPISQFITPPPPPCHFPRLVSIRLFSTSVSLFLPCKPVHLEIVLILKRYYILYVMLLTSSFVYIYIFLLKEGITEVQSWKQYSVKMGFNPPECSIHYIRDLSFYGALSPVRRIYGSVIEE